MSLALIYIIYLISTHIQLCVMIISWERNALHIFFFFSFDTATDLVCLHAHNLDKSTEMKIHSTEFHSKCCSAKKKCRWKKNKQTKTSTIKWCNAVMSVSVLYLRLWMYEGFAYAAVVCVDLFVLLMSDSCCFLLQHSFSVSLVIFC